MLKERLPYPSSSMENYITKLLSYEEIRKYTERNDDSNNGGVRNSNNLPFYKAKKKLLELTFFRTWKLIKGLQELGSAAGKC